MKLELSRKQLNSLIFVLGQYIDMSEITIQDPLGKDIEDKKELLKYLESKKPIELTKNTKQFLKLINEDCKYIARDESGDLKLFKDKPKRNKHYNNWISNEQETYIIKMLNIDLSFIKWEDEPYKITDLLGDEE